MTDHKPIRPKHVGFIMDGNRRWAKAQGKPTTEGHLAGQKTLHDIIYHAFEQGVEYASVYAFSTENWSRSNQEVKYLMAQVSKALLKYADELIENGIRVVILGEREKLPAKVASSIDEIERRTRDCGRATFAVCLNYGGHQEIVDATKKIIAGGFSAQDITPKLFADQLYYPEVPPLDLIIRTSGEQRLSNFMLWRAAYSEFIFRPEHWPAFTVDSLDECLLEYSKRQRRFGG